MKAPVRIAIVCLAWIVLIPIGVLGRAQPAEASVPPEDLSAAPEIEFGERLTRGSSRGANSALHRLSYRSFNPLPEPEWEIWPDEDKNQVVNLESFLLVTDGFESESWTISFGWVTIHFQSIPVWSIWDFEEKTTGADDRVTCIGPGQPWIPGVTNPYCGKEWEHSSDVTGTVEAEMVVRHLVTVWVNGSFAGIFPMDSPKGNQEILDVGEVLNYGESIALPVFDDPGGGGGSGFCSVWGINVVCWVGDKAKDAALAALYAVADWLEPVVEFVKGCGDAFIEQAGGIVDLAKTLLDAIKDPGTFVDEQLAMFKDLMEAAKADPEGFAEEVLKDILGIDYLEEEGGAAWAGKMVCNLLIEFLTSKAAATIAIKVKAFLRKRNGNGNGPDPDPDPDPTTNPCKISSFPGDTEVLMADGSHTRIDAIRPGDWVLSHNIDTSVWEPRLVVDQWSHLDRGPPATATLVDQSTVTATDDHLFWVPASGEWTQLQFVASGDQLLTPDGLVTVADVTVGAAADWLVWELTVADNHNFTVAAGDHDILVHNRSCGEGADDNLGKPIPGTNRKIGDKPEMTNDTPRRVIVDPGPPPVTRKPRAPSPDNPNFDHSKTRVDPDTGETTYFRKDGSSVTYDADGFPKFDSELDVYLNPDELGSGSNTRDFGSANDKVRESLSQDPSYLDDFPQDVQDFYNQDTVPNKPPPGYTWHHHQDTGRMQLVPDGIHGDFPHTGGASIWGGGD